jgi:hypothetical protein
MVECNPDLISMDDAIGRVGSAIYGDELIGSLTKREIWLIERYVEGSSTTNRCSIMPGLIRYDVAGRSWAEFPGDPALVAEVERARDRRDYSEEQLERAFDWLESHSFNIDASNIASGALAREMEKDFPSNKASGEAALLSDDDARALIRAAMERNGGFVGQEAGARIVREKCPDFNHKHAMALVKEMTGNGKPGPRGPRNNRANNRA